MNRQLLFFIGSANALLGLLGWKFHNAAQRESTYEAEASLMVERIGRMEENIGLLQDELEQRTLSNTNLAIDLQSSLDRATNLTAQRDHLKDELARLQMENSDIEKRADELELTIETLRGENLALREEPTHLSALNQQLERRLEEASTALHASKANQLGTPKRMELAGLSSDRQVFALTGEISGTTVLPRKVMLIDDSRVLLEGWLYRKSGDSLLGHVKEWHLDTSELVKGAKVFIVNAE